MPLVVYTISDEDTTQKIYAVMTHNRGVHHTQIRRVCPHTDPTSIPTHRSEKYTTHRSEEYTTHRSEEERHILCQMWGRDVSNEYTTHRSDEHTRIVRSAVCVYEKESEREKEREKEREHACSPA